MLAAACPLVLVHTCTCSLPPVLKCSYHAPCQVQTSKPCAHPSHPLDPAALPRIACPPLPAPAPPSSHACAAAARHPPRPSLSRVKYSRLEEERALQGGGPSI